MNFRPQRGTEDDKHQEPNTVEHGAGDDVKKTDETAPEEREKMHGRYALTKILRALACQL